jgi:hypothetical protein
MLPALYGSTSGSGGFSADGAFGNHHHLGHYDASIAQTLAPLNGDISRQVSLLPTVSPGSGFSLMFDPALKTFVTTTDSLGPIVGERADTIGRHRIAVGVSYQFFQFDKIDGVNLANFPAVFTHADDIADNAPTHVICSSSLTNTTLDQSLDSFDANAPNPELGDCSFVRDRITTRNRIDLKVHQITTYITFGLTKNLDVSLVIPYEEIRFGLSSEASVTTGTYFAEHVFSANGTCNLNNPLPNNLPSPPPVTPVCFGPHNFPDATIMGSGPSSSFATGIGDITMRLKGAIWRGERAGLAAGVDIRFPTGDALNYLGSGAYGVKPFAIVSYHSRLAPHGMIGIEANTSSVTSGNLATGAKGQIPNELTYDVGVDAYATKWLTGAFDIVGQRVFDAQTVAIASQQFLAPCATFDLSKNNDTSGMEPPQCKVFVQGNTTSACPNPNCYTQTTAVPPPVSASTLTSTSGTSYNITNASAGIKIAPLGRLVLTLNVLVRLDNGGLHAKPAPMGGLSYVF